MARRKGIKTAAVVAGVAVGTVAVATGAFVAACASVAPRRGDARLDARWRELSRYRYAHRGLHAEGIPENSLAAFRRARELGFGVELDVHLTLDGRLAVIHDSNLMRMCGCPGVVEEMTLSELGECRLQGTDEGIPILGEVLRLFEIDGTSANDDLPEAAPVIVEVKTRGENYALLTERVMACFDSYDVRYCVESFDPRVLAWLRANRPDVVRGQLAENFVKRGTGETPVPLIGRVLGTELTSNSIGRPDFVSYRYTDRHNPAVKLACDVLGGHLMTWVVHSESDLLASEAEGAPAIFAGFVPKSPYSTVKPRRQPQASCPVAAVRETLGRAQARA